MTTKGKGTSRGAWVQPLLWSCVLAAFLGVWCFQQFRPQKNVLENVTFAFNEGKPSFSAESLRLMSFGYPRVFTNLLWLRFLINTPPQRVPEGQVSWIYRDLDAISDLDPGFLPAYEYGGIFLSVVTTDKKGAEKILLKGIKQFPGKWRLYAYLAYHYEYELQDTAKASIYYTEGSKQKGAPVLLALLAVKHTGKLDAIYYRIKMLEGMKESLLDEKGRENIQNQIDKLKRQYGIR